MLAFLLAYVAFSLASGLLVLVPAFLVASAGIWLVKTAGNAAVAALAPPPVRVVDAFMSGLENRLGEGRS